MNEFTKPLFYPLVEACKAHGLKRTTAYKLAKSGALKTLKVSNRRFVTDESFKRFLAERLPLSSEWGLGTEISRVPQLAIHREGTAQNEERAYQSTELQKAVQGMLKGCDFNVLVTLTFRGNPCVSYDKAKKFIGVFVSNLRSSLYGDRSKRKIVLAPFIEGSEEQLREDGYRNTEGFRTHVHVLLKLEGDPTLYKDRVAKAWTSQSLKCGNPKDHDPSGHRWFRVIDGPGDLGRVSEYVSKFLSGDTYGLVVDYVHLG